MSDGSRWEKIRRAVRVPGLASVERDVDAEITFHIESRARELAAAGRTPQDAQAIALREFGDVDAARTELAAVDRRQRASRRHHEWFEAVRQDLAYTMRTLRRTPGLTGMVTLLLALGVGANAATFSVANDLFLQSPAGVTGADRIRRLYERTDWSVGSITVIGSNFEYAAYAQIDSVLGTRATLAGYTPADSTFVRDGSGIQQMQVSYTTANYFAVLGSRPQVGRFYTPEEDRMGAGARVAVISDALWRARYNGDPSVLGHSMEVALARYTIIGVAARRFSGSDLNRTDVWLPIATAPIKPAYPDRGWYQTWRQGAYVHVLARLNDGADDQTIATVATVAFRRGELAYVPRGPDTTATLMTGSLLEALAPSIAPSPASTITSRLVAVAGIVLLVTCANVMNLLLLSGLRRRREIAIRLALGISRRRLVMQLLMESLVVVVAAGTVAIGIAWWGAGTLRAMILPTTHWATSTLTPRVAGVALLMAAVTGLGAGFAPALRAGRADLTSSLKTGSRDGTVQRSRLRSSLLVAQTALSILLLAGAGLFVHSLLAVRAIDVGYDVDRVLYGTVDFRDPATRTIDYFGDARRNKLAAGLPDVAARIAHGPGVEATTLSIAAPLGEYGGTRGYRRDGTPLPRLDKYDLMDLTVLPDYFSVTGVRIVRGRAFTSADRAGMAPVIVVNETAAQTFWPGRDAIGQCLIIARPTWPCATVVGIAKNTHVQDVVEGPRTVVFMSILQSPPGYSATPTAIIVRAKPGETALAAATLRAALARTFPTAEPPFVKPLIDTFESQIQPWRVGSLLFSVFGGLALIVAIIGVYSAIAYEVSQRTHEMGVRIALGALPRQIGALVTRKGMGAVVVGVVVGLALAVASGRFIASMLYATDAHDVGVLAASTAVVLATGFFACLIPAWRAVRVDPVTALRSD